MEDYHARLFPAFGTVTSHLDHVVVKLAMQFVGASKNNHPYASLSSRKRRLINVKRSPTSPRFRTNWTSRQVRLVLHHHDQAP